MTALYHELEKVAGVQAPAIIKHLNEVGIVEWSDLTKFHLMALRDHLKDVLAPSSAKTIGACLSAFLHRYEEEGVIPCTDFAKVLTMRGERCQKTYLTKEEIERLERVETRKETEAYVLNEFLVGCRTGARISDIRHLTSENIVGGMLTYTSQKTGITATMPCSERTAERIAWLMAHPLDVNLVTYNATIRRLCKRAGIDTPTKVHKAGEDMTGPKWQFITSHSARISTCTNLAEMGVPMTDIAQIAGHTDISMTFRYVVRTAPKLNDLAMNFLG